jgi:hypothetical protein
MYRNGTGNLETEAAVQYLQVKNQTKDLHESLHKEVKLPENNINNNNNDDHNGQQTDKKDKL